MQVEMLVYVYLIVCLFMILFNLATVVLLRRRVRVDRKKEELFAQVISNQIAHQKQNDEQPDDEHRKKLLKKLWYTGNLLVYMQAVCDIFAERPDETAAYLRSVNEVFVRLIPLYARKKDTIKYAFYLYVLHLYCRMSGRIAPEMTEVMQKAIRVNNTYCRENALRAIYSFGQEEQVLEALRTIDDEGISHNRKLLVDGILSFHGDHQKLTALLWASFDGFSNRIRAVILDCMRFGAPADGKDRIYELLCDETVHHELRFSCLRFYAKYPDPKVYPLLLDFAKGSKDCRWEYMAIATSALAAYPGEQTMETLKKNLSHPNWHVRFNAAESLRKMGADYFDLIDVVDGDDRFAREIVQFQLDVRHNRREKVGDAV